MSVVYQILKLIVKVSLRFFYSKTTFENRERGYFKNPCIVVSNHPSTVMDPLNGVAWIGPSVKFLANASLFKTPFTNWFFNTFYCIKVERYQDTKGKPLDNALAFERARRHLEEGKPLFLAPEGGSFPNRELRKLKTGFARIAFDAESANDFQLGLTILPIGLNYEDSRKFRSELYTKFGEHILVADFRDDYEKDPVEGVRKLTDFLSESVKALLVHTNNKEEEYLQRMLEILLQHEAPLAAKENLERNQQLLVFLRNWEEQESIDFEQFRNFVGTYVQKLSSKVNSNAVQNKESRWRGEGTPNFEDIKLGDLALKKGTTFLKSSFQVLLLVLSFPFALIGFVCNFLPVFVPGFINRKFNKDGSYDSTFKYVSGLVLFPLFYWLQVEVVELFFEVDWFSLVYIFVFILTGLVAEWFLKFSKLFLKQIQFKERTDLRELRTTILESLDF